MTNPLLIAKNQQEIYIVPKMANRHGLITGATGTGKTVTLQTLAESFSKIGVPSFVADVKGDFVGISQKGGGNPKVEDRIKSLGLENFTYNGFPVTFWDVFGKSGHPARTTISEMGPLLLARLLNLNEVQSGVLTATFEIADDNGMLLMDLKDLRSMIAFVGENASDYTTKYGNISTASVGAIQRSLLALEQQGAAQLFGEPALNLYDLMQTQDGLGMINILAADQLMHSPKVYSTFLLFLLSELFEELPEVGDLEKPKLVFFFDEAHLLFSDAPPALLEKIQHVVRLVRSKGVGIYFITQNPLDIPDIVLGQLGNRIQHALRAFTPRDQKAVKAAATTFRQNPEINTEETITQLGVGEALVSFLDEKGSPSIVQRAWIIPPHSRIGAITPDERTEIIRNSNLYGHYEKQVDRESAYEMLMEKAEQKQLDEKQEVEAKEKLKAEKNRKPEFWESIAKSATRSVTTAIAGSLGRAVMRGVLGSISGSTKSRR